MRPSSPLRSERIRRLLQAVYREELRTAAYRVYRRRARDDSVGTMLDTFLRVEERVLSRLEGHLVDLDACRPGRPGLLRRGMGWLGATLARLTVLGGDPSILRRIRAEERRGGERYGREVEWKGWSPAERDTLDGHRCDQLYQNHWAEEVERDVERGRA